MSIKIIAGSLKGRILKTINKKKDYRPLLSRIRKSIFDKLQFIISNAVVLDLYAGSGSFGIEALSRGAKFVTFVETNKYALETIRQNLANFGITKNVSFINKDVIKFLKTQNQALSSYNLIFFDPPFRREDLAQLSLDILLKIKASYLIILRTHYKTKIFIPRHFNYDTKTIGESRLYFLDLKN